MAGLVTGGDLIAQLRGKALGERLLIPANMLRAGERVFLDDVTLDDVERALGVPVSPVAQDGYELLDAMCGLEVPPLEQVSCGRRRNTSNTDRSEEIGDRSLSSGEPIISLAHPFSFLASISYLRFRKRE